MHLTVDNLFRNRLFLIVFLFVLFRPEIVKQYTYLDLIVTCIRILAIFVVIYCFIIKKQFSNYNLLFLLFFFCGYNLLSVFYDCLKFHDLINFALVIAVLLLIEFTSNKNDFKPIHFSLGVYIWICTVCNIISIFMVNDENNQFLGFDNDILMKILPLTIAYLSLSSLLYKRFLLINFVLLLLLLINFCLTWSATALVSYALLIVMLYVLPNRIFQYIKLKFIVVFPLVIFILLYYFQVQYYFSWFFVDFLGKDLLLNYRMYLWESSVDAISNKPLLGFGNIVDSIQYYNIVTKLLSRTIVPHNMWLYITSTTGFVGLVFFIVFVYKKLIVIFNLFYLPCAKVIISGIFVFCISASFASLYPFEYIFFMIFIAEKEGIYYLKLTKNNPLKSNDLFNPLRKITK